MSSPDHHDSSRPTSPHLKTATAAADPVLIRLSSAHTHTVLLAQDVTYDKAGAIHLHNVRWSHTRRNWRTSLGLAKHSPLTSCDQVKLLRNTHEVIGLIPNAATCRASAHRRSFKMINLSASLFETYLSASTRRLLQATRSPSRSPRPILAALTAFHRLRFILRNTPAPVR